MTTMLSNPGLLGYLACFFILAMVNIIATLVGVPYRKAFRLDFIVLAILNICALLYSAQLGEAHDIDFITIKHLVYFVVAICGFDIIVRCLLKIIQERR